MKKICTILLALACAAQVFAQQGLTFPPNGGNQKAKVVQWIGPVSVSITYSSPDVHGPNGADRTGHIWGELVHYGFVNQGFGTSQAAPWRAGANENTTIAFSHDVKIDGKTVPAGTYGLFLDVEKDGPWTWILSKNNSSWGSYFYNPAEDAARVQATPSDAAYTEFLTYSFEDRQPTSAVAYLQWENKKAGFRIEVPNVNDIYIAGIRNDLRSEPGFDPRNWAAAAQYCANNKVNLEEALTWVDFALNPANGGQEDFNNLSVKASVLMAMNRGQEAGVIMDKAIRHPSATVPAIHQYGRTLLNLGMKDKALEVFQYNAKTHPEDKFTTSVGLARGYSAVGNKKEAIKNWEVALKNVPANQTANRPVWEAELTKLKEGK
jgi:hypothetical protein